MRRLIFTADDFGPIKGINRGVRHAIIGGKLGSVASLVNFDEAEEVVVKYLPLFNEYDIEVGLHLTITSGKSVANPKLVPSLVNSDGTFKLLNEINAGEIRKEELLIELESQYQRFVDLYGYHPKHISNHQAILDIIPSLFITYNKFCASKGGPKRSAVLFPEFQKRVYFRYLKKQLKWSKSRRNYLLDLMKHIVRLKEFGRLIKVKSPHRTDVRYYWLGNKFSIYFAFQNVRKNKINEYILHLYEGEVEREYNYKGVNVDYFEGRKKELHNLLKSSYLNFIQRNAMKFGVAKWSDL